MDGAAQDTLIVVIDQWCKEIGLDPTIEILDQIIDLLELRRDEYVMKEGPARSIT
jgi:hypothetical protein